MNHIATAFALAVLGYLGFVLVAPTPIATLDRICVPPLVWPKKVLVAGARVVAPSAEVGITRAFDNGFGRCRAWGWGVFYEDEYRAIQKAKEAAAAQDSKAAKDAK